MTKAAGLTPQVLWELARAKNLTTARCHLLDFNRSFIMAGEASRAAITRCQTSAEVAVGVQILAGMRLDDCTVTEIAPGKQKSWQL